MFERTGNWIKSIRTDGKEVKENLRNPKQETAKGSWKRNKNKTENNENNENKKN